MAAAPQRAPSCQELCGSAPDLASNQLDSTPRSAAPSGHATFGMFGRNFLTAATTQGTRTTTRVFHKAVISTGTAGIPTGTRTALVAAASAASVDRATVKQTRVNNVIFIVVFIVVFYAFFGHK